MSHIRNLKYQSELTQAKISEADGQIVQLMSYLQSAKFNCGDSLDGYVHVNDVIERLRSVRETFYKDGEDFDIHPDPVIEFKRVRYAQDIFVLYEIVYKDSYQNSTVIGRIGRIDSEEAGDYYDAKSGIVIAEFYSTPVSAGQVTRFENETTAKTYAREKAKDLVREQIERKHLLA